MNQAFVVRGINPATGRVTEIIVLAPSDVDAKSRAQLAGLLMVTATARVEPLEQTGDAAPSAAAPAAKPPQLILVVDDYPSVGETLVRLLRGEGYEAIAMTDPAAALAFLKSSQPALVILDNLMPGMGGLTFLTRMRENEKLRAVPVIMFSASDDREVALRAGADAYIAKDSMDWPVLRDEMARLIGPGVLGKPRSDAAPSRARDVG